MTADLTESDRRKCLALTRSSCGGFLREAISVATFNLFIRSCDAWARRHAPLPTLRLLLKKWQNVSALETTANEYITRRVNSLDSGASSGRGAAVSVNTVPERSYNHQINVILTRYVPGLAEAVTRTFSLGEASRLEELFRECGFSQIETRTVTHTFVLPSFDAYYGPFERGGASTGQALAALPDELRRAVRDEVRRDFDDTSRPIEVEAEYRIASGRR